MHWRDSPWVALILERFPPATTLPMILLFVIANGLMASHMMVVHTDWWRYLLAFLLALSFFFRLRLFDEL